MGEPEIMAGAPLETPARRWLGGGAALSGISRGSVAVTGAATTVIVAHVLGPPGYGAFAVAQTLILILMVFTTLGIEHGIVYYVSSGRWSPSDAFKRSQQMALWAGLIGAGGGLLTRALVPAAFHRLSPAAAAIAVASLPFALSWFYSSYVSLARDDYEGFVLPPAIQSVLALAMVGALSLVDGVLGAIIGLSAAHALTALTGLLQARKIRAAEYTQGTSAQPIGEPLSRAIRFGIKGYASNALQAINYRLDLLVLNAVAASAVVGHYAAAVSITSVMWLLPQALSDVLFPRVAALSASSRADDAEAVRFAEAKGLRHCVLATVAGALALALALVLLVVPIYGQDFKPSIDLGLILLPGVSLLAVTNTMAATIVGRGRPELMLIVTLIITPLTVLLYVLLIPPFHATGAALASTVSYSGAFVLTLLAYRRTVGRNALAVMLPTRSEFADYSVLLRRVIPSRPR